MAVTIGSYTVGTGGTYANWKAALDDMGTLSGSLTFTQISIISEAVAIAITSDLNGETLTLTSSVPHKGDTTKVGGITRWQGDNNFIAFSVVGGGGTIILENLYLKVDTPQTGSRSLIKFQGGSEALNLKVRDCILDGNLDYGSLGILIDDSDITLSMHNVLARRFTLAGIDIATAKAGSHVENCTTYGGDDDGIRGSANVTFSNNVATNCNGECFGNIVSASGYNNASDDNTAQNGNWATGDSNIVSIKEADEFLSLSFMYSDFMRVAVKGTLENGGRTPVISENTTGIRGNVRGGDTTSIGADEFRALTITRYKTEFVKDGYIRNKTYFGRAVANNGALNLQKSFIMDKRGYLYGIVGTSQWDHEVYRSEDNGYTWSIYPGPGSSYTLNPRTAADLDGQFMHLFHSEVEDEVYSVSAQYDSDDDWVVYNCNTDQRTGLDTMQFLGDAISFVGDPDHDLFLVAQAADDGEPLVNRVYLNPPGFDGTAANLPLTSFYTYPIEVFDTVTNNESSQGTIHMAWVCGDFQGDPNAPTMAHFIFQKPKASGSIGTWTSASLVWRGEGRLSDPGIAVDGTNRVAIVCGHHPSGSPAPDQDYQLFATGDTGWASGVVPRPIGTSGYIDPNTGKPLSRCSIIGDRIAGFIIAGIFEADGGPNLYVTEFDGTNWPDANDWKRVNSLLSDEVTGGQFFRWNDGTLNDIRNKGSLRMAYQVGHGNSDQGSDSVRTKVKQEKLTNNAYPIPVSGVIKTQEHQDYFKEGMTGGNTGKYVETFSVGATAFSITKYEPIAAVDGTDKGAYELESTVTVSGFFDPQVRGIATPEPVVNVEDEEQFTGTLFLGPQQYLPVDFVRNEGNYVKKTEYVFYYQSKEYSLTSITPRFLNNEICYWECQTRVIGPTYNPFTRIIYASEF